MELFLQRHRWRERLFVCSTQKPNRAFVNFDVEQYKQWSLISQSILQINTFHAHPTKEQFTSLKLIRVRQMMLQKKLRIRSQHLVDFLAHLVTSAVNGVSLNSESKIVIASVQSCRRKYSQFQNKEIITWVSNLIQEKLKLISRSTCLRNRRPPRMINDN